MTDRRGLEESLLTEVTRRLAEISATQLRTGKGAESVLAEVREQSPELLQDYCKIHVTLTSPPLRPVPRVAASA